MALPQPPTRPSPSLRDTALRFLAALVLLALALAPALQGALRGDDSGPAVDLHVGLAPAIVAETRVPRDLPAGSGGGCDAEGPGRAGLAGGGLAAAGCSRPGYGRGRGRAERGWRGGAQTIRGPPPRPAVRPRSSNPAGGPVPALARTPPPA